MRREELHRRLRDDVEAAVADFEFTDPRADERAFALRENIIDAELTTIRTGVVPDLSFCVDLGRRIAEARLPLDHHFVAHRIAYPLLLDVALDEADRLALDATVVREIVTRHQRYTAATTEACVGAYVEARDIATLENERSIRALLDDLQHARSPWPIRLANHAAAFHIAADTSCMGLLITWEHLPTDMPPELLRRRISAWLSLAPSDPLISAHVALEGLIALRPDSRPTAIVDTLRRAIRQLSDQSVGGLRCGLSVVGPASSARQLVTDASVALNATNSVEPVRWLAEMTALDYLVATSPPVIRRLVTGGSTALHTLDDKTDPTCRRVLDTWCEHQADLRAVAADLHCHPNTVLNRLRRIREITGYDPRKPTDLVQLITDLAILDQHRNDQT